MWLAWHSGVRLAEVPAYRPEYYGNDRGLCIRTGPSAPRRCASARPAQIIELLLQRAQRLAPVAALVLQRRRHFGGCQPGLRILEHRVVAEAARRPAAPRVMRPSQAPSAISGVLIPRLPAQTPARSGSARCAAASGTCASSASSGAVVARRWRPGPRSAPTARPARRRAHPPPARNRRPAPAARSRRRRVAPSAARSRGRWRRFPRPA